MAEQSFLFPIPPAERLSTDKLAKVFLRLGSSYKLYWFLSLLEAIQKKRTDSLDARDLAISMVTNAWYSVTFYHLDLGFRDGICEAIKILNKEEQLTNPNADEVERAIRKKFEEDPDFRKLINSLLFCVPQRFLSPWIGSHTNKEGFSLAKDFVNDAPYRISKDRTSMIIEINPEWLTYFSDNFEILQDFTKWHLARYIQQKNPIVPNVMEKIQRPTDRKSMKLQKDFWHDLIKGGMEVTCIYTGRQLKIGHYDLDHFMPWNFVAHNYLWNLIPADSSVNSKKGDGLPDLRVYLEKFATTQQKAISKYLEVNKESSKVLEDFLSIRKSAKEISSMDKEKLMTFYGGVFDPLVKEAETIGFETWTLS